VGRASPSSTATWAARSTRSSLPSAYGKKLATHREAMGEVIDWLTFYNHRRLHSTLGHQSDEVRSKLAVSV
jgi:transposase InsO family protein